MNQREGEGCDGPEQNQRVEHARRKTMHVGMMALGRSTSTRAIMMIALSALATGSLVVAIFGDSKPGTIIGAGISTLLLGFTLYFKEATLGEQAQKHSVVAARLWGIRERLLSLLVDMKDGRPDDEVRKERDRVNATLEDIYKNAPRTSAKAYEAAQKALKVSEELYFTDEELNKMLPKPLRVTKAL